MSNTLYLDMDGVVADFDGYAQRILNGNKPNHTIYPDSDWRTLRSNPRLYRDLNKMQDSDQLVQGCRTFCQQRGLNLMFLTAIPHDNDMPWAFYDKVVWVQTHYPDIAVHFGPYSHDKHTHCNIGDILIDDRLSNIEEWNAAGGVGILYSGNASPVLDFLKSL